MPESPRIGNAIGLPPADAIRYFEAKGLKLTGDWRELWQAQHARAFTVARLAKIDVLKDIHGGLTDALKEGKTERDFIRELTPTLQRKGWWGQAIDKETGEVLEAYDATGRPVQWGSPWRLKLIYRQNLQTAYMAGRYRHQQEMAASGARPYWQYLAVRDSRTRPSHAGLHGRVYRADDPVWSSIYPPNGWNCRCRVRALSDRRLQAEGLTPETGRTETVEVPAGKLPDGSPDLRPVTAVRYTDRTTGRDMLMKPDAGWSYNPGQAGLSHLGELHLAGSAQAPAMLGSLAAREALADDRVRRGVEDGYQEMAREVFAGLDADQPRPHGRVRHIGALSTDVIASLERRGMGPESGVVSVRENDLIHMARDKKAGGVDRDWLLDLPAHLTNPRAALLDTTHDQPAVLLVHDHGSDDRKKLVVQLDYRVRQRKPGGGKETVRANVVNTARVVPVINLREHQVLDGAL
ncbi:phage minor head protein [Guyparkeria halophila]|uniref:Phage minor head protein n=1 Tax=Guyparkeria halophila TaxID=47960 RepID=A0ABZ0YY36_9GAMM|nr:phage minor head protein [Guyparkeria halophila]WQH16147.1 phage minor head protein [Guyparkeria halophila]